MSPNKFRLKRVGAKKIYKALYVVSIYRVKNFEDTMSGNQLSDITRAFSYKKSTYQSAVNFVKFASRFGGRLVSEGCLVVEDGSKLTDIVKVESVCGGVGSLEYHPITVNSQLAAGIYSIE